MLLNTIRYFDLFDQPVTAVQLWQVQIGADRVQSLWEIQDEAGRLLAAGRVETLHGFYFLPQRQAIVRQWLRRHGLAQQKWKLTYRIVRWLQYVPFVQMIAMSGSLASGNTRSTSDLDLFVVVKRGRIWLARLGLLALVQLLGRRRRHWDRSAPDKICLNHYVTDQSLTIASDIQNVYTAVLYQALLGLTGWSCLHSFLRANQAWMNRFMLWPEQLPLPTRHAVSPIYFLRRSSSALEAVVAEPLWNWLEKTAEWLQRRVILRHTKPGQTGRVVVNNNELAFHPNTKVPGLLDRYYQNS